MPTIHFVGASNGLSQEAFAKLLELEEHFEKEGFSASDPNVTLAPPGGLAHSPSSRSQTLFDALQDPECLLIADPTGGELANQVLRPLMARLHEISPSTKKAYWSMSDNSVLLNAFLDKGLCRIFHGHCLTLCGKDAVEQRRRFEGWVSALALGTPIPSHLLPSVTPARGHLPTAELFGGNLRGLTKLLGTPWFPKTRGRVLLVESLSLQGDQVLTLLEQLGHAGVYENLAGILVGRFNQLEKNTVSPSPAELVAQVVPEELPIAQTPYIGHGSFCWTVPFGETISWTEDASTT